MCPAWVTRTQLSESSLLPAWLRSDQKFSSGELVWSLSWETQPKYSNMAWKHLMLITFYYVKSVNIRKCIYVFLQTIATTTL